MEGPGIFSVSKNSHQQGKQDFLVDIFWLEGHAACEEKLSPNKILV
jgi:hypothetical protein